MDEVDDHEDVHEDEVDDHEDEVKMIMSISTTICVEQGKKILTWIRHLKRLFVLPGLTHGELGIIIQHLELVWVGFRRGGGQVYED